MPNDSVTWPLPGPSASSQAGGRLAPLWLWGGGRQSARGVGLRAGRVPWPRSQRPPLLTGSSSRGRSGAGGEATAAASGATWRPRRRLQRNHFAAAGGWSLAVGNTDFVVRINN